jgi:hypothetical protein
MKPQENYYPSNGTEFMQFHTNNCDDCYKEKQCSILRGAIVLGIEPKQWVISNENKPVCTSLSKQRPKAKTTAKNDLPKLF